MYETRNSKKRKEEKGNAKLEGRGGKDGGEEIKEGREKQGRKERSKKLHYKDVSPAKAGNQIGSDCFFLDTL